MNKIKLFLLTALVLLVASSAFSQGGIVPGTSRFVRRAADGVTCNASRKGHVYFNTVSNTQRNCNGTAWADAGGGGGEVEVGVTPSDGTANVLLKTNGSAQVADASGLTNGSAGNLTAAQGSLAGSSTPFLSHTATWNNAGTAFTNIFSNITDTNSDAASLLFDLQVGGLSKFKVNKTGAVTASSVITASQLIASPSTVDSHAGFRDYATNNNIDFPETGVWRFSRASGAQNLGLLFGKSVAPKATSPYTITVLESGRVFTNEGAAARQDFELPSAVAGMTYTFIVQDTDGIRVIANTGDTIRVAASVSAAAGRIDAATIGNAITIVAINATEWVAISNVGTWTAT